METLSTVSKNHSPGNFIYFSLNNRNLSIFEFEFAYKRTLRSGYGGLLRMNPVFQHYGLKDLLPAKTDMPEEGCTHRAENGNQFCFDAGNRPIDFEFIVNTFF